MKKKLLITLAAVLVLLSGCTQKMTAAVIAAKAASNMQKTTSAVMDLEIGLNADIDTSALTQSFLGMPIDLGPVSTDIQASLRCETTSDPSALHGTGSLNLNIPMVPEIPVEMYVVPENGESMMYTSTAGMWIKKSLPARETKETESQPWYKMIFGTWQAVSDDMISMDEGTVEKDGRECYVLHGNIPSSMVYDFLVSSVDLSSILGDTSSIDFGDQKTPVTIYVDKEKLLPYILTMDDPAFANTLMAGTKLSPVSLKDMSLKVTYQSFDSVESITVPQEAVQNAQAF